MSIERWARFRFQNPQGLHGKKRLFVLSTGRQASYCSYRKVISGHGSNGDALKHRRIEKTNGACAESEHLAEDTAEKPAEGRAGLESV